MDIDSLNLFVEVVQQRGFARVARSRNIDPSSVSRTIAKLEKELQIRLFERSTRKLKPTESGIIYYERIVNLLEQLETAQQLAADTHQQPQGKLRITVSSAFAQKQVIPLLPEFARRYPDLSVEMIITDAYLDLIEERIDLAIRLGTLQDSSYIVRKLRIMSFYVCASAKYLEQYGTPQQPQDIEKHNCLLFPRANGSLDWLFSDKKGRTQKIATTGQYLITNSLAIKECAIAGMGLALLPDWLVAEDLKSGNLIRLFPHYEVTTSESDSSIWLLYPSKAYLPTKTRVFIDYCVEHLSIVA